MRVAILCAGRSVVSAWERRESEPWDVVVGINAAAWLVDVDWLCWMDGCVIRGMIERGRAPRIGSVWHVSDLRFWHDRETEAYPSFGADSIVRAPTTLPNAVNWALGKWPGCSLEMIGCDMDDGPNCGGLHSVATPQRWAMELSWIRRAIERNRV